MKKIMALDLNPRQKDFLDSESHVLVTGGAGSGKTTVAILKAASLSHSLKYDGQRILFLSFARPTIARVEEAIQQNKWITKAEKSAIEVDTYHSFFWHLLNSHGYLLGLPRSLEILEGYNEAELLLDLRESFGGKPNPHKSEEDKERYEAYLSELHQIRWNCAKNEGKVAFDLFAPLVAEMLQKSKRIRELVALKYPFIILDEFQDTDADQWEVVSQIGKCTTLLALADPEQQIYRWKGADPMRLAQYQDRFGPEIVDFEQSNYRSPGTDIALLGNEILTQAFSKKSSDYTGVAVIEYGGATFCNKDMAYKQLNLATIAARKRLRESGKKDWSLAILTGSKDTTKRISELMSTPPAGCAKIGHRPLFDLEAAVLGAGIVSAGFEQNKTLAGQERFVRAVVQFLKGRNGDGQPKAAYVATGRKVESDLDKHLANPGCLLGGSVCSKMLAHNDKICELVLSGDPWMDWVLVRNHLETSGDARLTDAGQATRYLRLIERSTDLRSTLLDDWQANGRYANAFRLVGEAFVQEHFSLGRKPETGVVVMNIHKAKGKEFDEVIIFDGFTSMFQGQAVPGVFSRIAFGNRVNDDTKQNLRVAVTRAKSKTTILTPMHIPCALLKSFLD